MAEYILLTLQIFKHQQSIKIATTTGQIWIEVLGNF